MLYIHGIGHALPETVIGNDLLAELNKELKEDWISSSVGIASRRSTLPLAYIRETGNQKPEEGRKSALQSPTELGIAAAELALERAGISWEDIGLIVGDCATPRQTTPSEAQRIGNHPFRKIPAFDVIGLSAALPLHLSSYFGTRGPDVPKYILAVSTNTPTQTINYSNGVEGAMFGDAAGAVILSPTRPGALRVESAHYGSDPQASDIFTCPMYGHISAAKMIRNNAMRIHLEASVSQALEGLDPTLVKFIGGQPDVVMLHSVLESRGISHDRNWSLVSEVGCALGASPLVALSSHWEELVPGDSIICAVAGAGLNYGNAVLTVC